MCESAFPSRAAEASKIVAAAVNRRRRVRSFSALSVCLFLSLPLCLLYRERIEEKIETVLSWARSVRG